MNAHTHDFYATRCAKYERILRRLRQVVFDNEDPRIPHLMARCKDMCSPHWRRRADQVRQRMDEKLFRLGY